MSQEMFIIAIVPVKSDGRDRFIELSVNAMDWIQKNEPGTLQFEIFEEKTDEGYKFSFYEHYASKEAMESHRNSENYKKLFENIGKEEPSTPWTVELQTKNISKSKLGRNECYSIAGQTFLQYFITGLAIVKQTNCVWLVVIPYDPLIDCWLHLDTAPRSQDLALHCQALEVTNGYLGDARYTHSTRTCLL
nr:hypothetical protein CFP56_30856 [Quercus suber]